VNARSAWWQRWYLWVVPLFVVVLNGVWLLGLRGAVLGRGSLLATQAERLQADVSRLRAHDARLQHTHKALGTLQDDLVRLRGKELGSMQARLVPFLLDVVRRAEEAGLQPERISYRASTEKKSGLIHFAATYGVSGTYEQVRRCINLLETSPQFVLIERLALRGDETASSLDVGVQVTVGTYFSEMDEHLMKNLGVTEASLEAELDAAGTPPPGAGGASPESEFHAVDSKFASQVKAAAPASRPTPNPLLERGGRGRIRIRPSLPRHVPVRPPGAAGEEEQQDVFVKEMPRREVSGGT
jgi:hypothetical protein